LNSEEEKKNPFLSCHATEENCDRFHVALLLDYYRTRKEINVMDFGSKYVYTYAHSEEESVSEDEDNDNERLFVPIARRE